MPHGKGSGIAREIPMMAYDYMKQRTQENRTEGIATLPTLAGIEYDTGWITGTMVQKKGFDEYAVAYMVRDVEQHRMER